MMAWRDLGAKGGNRQSVDIAKGRSEEGERHAGKPGRLGQGQGRQTSHQGGLVQPKGYI